MRFSLVDMGLRIKTMCIALGGQRHLAMLRLSPTICAASVIASSIESCRVRLV